MAEPNRTVSGAGQPGQPQAPSYHAPHPPPIRQPVAPPPNRSAVVPAQAQAPAEKELEPLSLVEDRQSAAAAAPPPKKIMAFGSDMAHKRHDWRRQLNHNGTGAMRVRSFHGKCSDQGLEFLDNSINEWLDANPDMEVKFVTTTVATFEGKIREPALVVNVWY